MTMPDRIVPMEPVSRTRPLDDPDFIHQIKWDGVRMIAFVHRDRVRLQNRRLNDRTSTYPEVVAMLGQQRMHDTIVDGEVVVIDSGRPSFRLTMNRDSSASPDRNLIDRLPAVYVVFDLLYVGGESICSLPLCERLDRLRDLVTTGDHLVVTDDYVSGSALFEELGQRNWEGIVSKRTASPYLVGRKSQDWHKVKHAQYDTFLVTGLLLRRGQVASLILSEHSGPGVRPVGRAASGLSDRQRDQLAQLATREIAGGAYVSYRGGQTIVTLKHALMADVRYHERTDAMGLRAPVIKNLVWPGGDGGGD